MIVVKDFKEMRDAREKLAEPVGFVPTMGFLHDGHISLVRAARSQCKGVVVSIFVNPTQFGPSEDFSSYPRDTEHDLALLEAAGVDLVWMPEPAKMYPEGYQTWVTVEQVTQPLEGSMRPGHFRGVTTVVAKLFNGVQPQKAYFGQKDAQQALVIKQMVRDLNYPLDIVICPIRRESDGLALSSRNTYLNPAERKGALVLSQSLKAAQEAFTRGERNTAKLKETIQKMLSSEPLAKVQYVSIADAQTLQEVEKIQTDVLISMAVYFGKTRLIDNCILKVINQP
jgi:pantoate--beta-alanine ligase